jgi:hypothetical protein
MKGDPLFVSARLSCHVREKLTIPIGLQFVLFQCGHTTASTFVPIQPSFTAHQSFG